VVTASIVKKGKLAKAKPPPLLLAGFSTLKTRNGSLSLLESFILNSGLIGSANSLKESGSIGS